MFPVTEEISIRLGVPQSRFAQATRLYCDAFREKLSPFLGPIERAAQFLAMGLNSDRAFVALRDGDVVGIAGFKLSNAGLFEPSVGQFWREYKFSAPVRMLGLALLEREEVADCLLMDGIAVRDDARGKGIGTRLLRAIEGHARSLGKHSIRLDVIDTNPGARRLYERFGFRAGETSGVGPYRVLFRFRSATTMRKLIVS